VFHLAERRWAVSVHQFLPIQRRHWMRFLLLVFHRVGFHLVPFLPVMGLWAEFRSAGLVLYRNPILIWLRFLPCRHLCRASWN
jgi:hypothetical protein